MRYQKTKITTILLKIIALALVPAIIIGAMPAPAEQPAAAYTQADVDDLQRQIDALRAKEDDLAKRTAEIAAETAGFEREKSRLQNEIAILENNIALLAVEIAKLASDIEINENKIHNTELAISETLVDMYMMDDITTIERLASSKSFSSFIDDTTRQSASTDSLATAVESIKVIKAELERQRTEVQNKQDNQKAQKQTMEARRTELQRAINGNRAEQAAFVADKEATMAQRKELSNRQSEIMWELAKDSIGGSISKDKGGYPYQGECPRRIDDYIEDYGMYVCECTSYAAWKVHQYHGYKVREKGKVGSYDARYWDDNLYGVFPISTTPRPRSVAVWEDGTYGHVAWVEHVDASGNVYVSEYNVLRGDYSERNASASSGWLNARHAKYIYFN